MERVFLRSKIHRATVTESRLDYEGSITLDLDLVDAAGLSVYEKVQVVNITNGARFETYIIEGQRGSGVVCINGAAARLVQVSDKVIIMGYCHLTSDEISAHKPQILQVDAKNRVISGK